MAAAVKIADGEDGARPRLRSEARSYRYLRDLPVLKMLGYRRQRRMDVLVLERALFSLDALLTARPTTSSRMNDALIQTSAMDVIAEAATMAGSSLVRLLRGLAQAPDARAPVGHGDLRLENVFMVQRDGVLKVVIGDLGSPSHVVDIDDDVHAAGLTLWELLHDGRTPFVLERGALALRRDDPRLAQKRHHLELDTDSCNVAGACVLGGVHESDGSAHVAVHRLAEAILLCGREGAPGARREVLGGSLADAVVTAGADLERAQIDGEYRSRPARELMRVMVFTDVAGADVHAKGWMPSGPPPRSRFGLEDRRPIDQRALARLRRLTTPARLGPLVAAVAVGIVVGCLASSTSEFLTRAPIASAASEHIASVLVAAASTVLTVPIIFVAWLFGRGVPHSHRAPFLERWSAAAALSGFATAWVVVGSRALASAWSPPASSGASTGPWPEVVALGAATAAMAANALIVVVVERAHYAARLRRRRRWTRWIPTTATAAFAIVAAVVSLLNGPITSPTLPASVQTLHAGMPGEEPAFFNPDGMSVADDGSIAVLERYANEADTVWIKRPDSQWAAEVRVPRRRSAAEVVSSTVVSPLDALRASLPAWERSNAVPHGDRLTSISDLGFLDAEHLAVVGSEGVSVIDLEPDTPVAHTVDAYVRADGSKRGAALAVVDGGLLVGGFDQDDFEAGHAGVIAAWKQTVKCPDATTGDPEEIYVVKITDPLGDVRVAPPTWKDSSGENCRRNAWDIVSDGSSGAVIEYAWDGSRRNLTYRPLDDRPGKHLTNDWSGWVGPGVEQGGRLLIPFGNCLQGFDLNESDDAGASAPNTETTDIGKSRPSLPLVADRTWYTESVEDDECRQPAGTPGFIGADVEPEAGGIDRPTSDSDTPSSQTQRADTCTPPRAGVSVLDLRQWQQKTLAVRPDGSILFAAPAGSQCTSALWSLDAKASDWMPVGDVLTQRMDADAATMLTVNPASAASGSSWFTPGHWAVLSDDGSWDFANGGEANSYRALTPRIAEVPGLSVGAFASYSEGLDPDVRRTKLVIDNVDSKLGDFEVKMPGIEDLASVRASEDDDDMMVMALCDGIFSFNPMKLGASKDTSGWFVPARESFTQIAGDADLGLAAEDLPSSRCGDIATEPRDAQSSAAYPLRPTAVDAVEIGAEVVVAYAESGTFAGQRVSRVRVVDPADQLGDGGEGEAAVTLGCDADPSYDGGCLGDLTDLGLEASDIAVSEDGAIAVSTTTADGWGPVLLFRDGERRVVRLDAGVLATGVAWSAGRLVITDAARGDVLALTFPR